MTTSKGEALLLEHCKIYRLEPVTEYKFHPKRQWRFDFAWPDKKLAVEVEGGSWQNGRHTRGSGFRKDCEKYNSAALLGWRVMRFTTDMVIGGEAICRVLEAMQ